MNPESFAFTAHYKQTMLALRTSQMVWVHLKCSHTSQKSCKTPWIWCFAHRLTQTISECDMTVSACILKGIQAIWLNVTFLGNNVYERTRERGYCRSSNWSLFLLDFSLFLNHILPPAGQIKQPSSVTNECLKLQIFQAVSQLI